MKRNLKQTAMICLATLLAAVQAGASEAGRPGSPPVLPTQAATRGVAAFAETPAAVRSGDAIEITFAVKAPIDAEVSVVDAQGRIVRHLAAGMLGDNAPRPFSRGLKQELTWDGEDDAGKPAVGGPFRVRVALGMKARLHRTYGWNGHWLRFQYAAAADCEVDWPR
jgi:hypothetical protein